MSAGSSSEDLETNWIERREAGVLQGGGPPLRWVPMREEQLYGSHGAWCEAMLGVKPWYEAMEHGGGAGGGKTKEQCVSRDSRSLGRGRERRGCSLLIGCR